MRWRAVVIGAVLVVISLFETSQAGVDTAWVRTYSGPTPVPYLGVALELDAAGNVFVGGTGFDEITGNDCVILKYDPDGDLLWERRYNGPGDSTDAVTEMTLDDQGNVYVAGYSWDDATGFDVVTLAYDTDGNPLWEKRYDASGYSPRIPSAIALDASGNLFVAFQCGFLSYFLLKYDSQGVLLWDRAPGYSGGYRPPALAIDEDGNAYLAGDAGLPHGTPARLIKYDPDGNLLFDEFYGCGFDDCLFRTIKVLSDGNVVIAGYGLYDNLACFKYTSTGQSVWWQNLDDPGWGDEGIALELDTDDYLYIFGYVFGGYQTSGGSSYDYAMWKVDNVTSDSIWAHRYNGPGNELDWPLDMALDQDASSYGFGYSQALNGSYDWVFLKYSKDGLPLWHYRFDGSGEDSMQVYYSLPGAVAVDPMGDVYATGYMYSEANGFKLTTARIDASCHCPYQGDGEPDGFMTAIDLAAVIDALFAGGTNPQDVGCPVPRFDLDCDAFTTALDLSIVIDYLFAGGTGPCDPCD